MELRAAACSSAGWRARQQAFDMLKKPGTTMKLMKTFALLCLMAGSIGAAFAQEAAIRKNLAERLPDFAKIDEVSATPMNGLYEIRINGSDIFYTDAEGNFLLRCKKCRCH